MSVDIADVMVLSGGLTAGDDAREWLGKAWDGEFDKVLPEVLPEVRADGTVEMKWNSIGGDQAIEKGTLAEFLALTRGSADFLFVYEDGAGFLGVRVVEGKTTFHKVSQVLGEEIDLSEASPNDGRASDDDDEPDSEPFSEDFIDEI